MNMNAVGVAVVFGALCGAARGQDAAPKPPVPAEPGKTEPAKTEPSKVEPAKTQQPPKDPSVDQIIKDLEKSSPKREDIRAVNPAAPAGSAPGTPATTAAPAAGVKVEPRADEGTTAGKLLREGTFLVSRRGRMVKTRGGEWAFVFDADATGKADVPMILQPCLRLQEMEKAATAAGATDAVTFTLSGQVFVYKGRNYLLPTLSIINRPDPNLGR